MKLRRSSTTDSTHNFFGFSSSFLVSHIIFAAPVCFTILLPLLPSFPLLLVTSLTVFSSPWSRCSDSYFLPGSILLDSPLLVLFSHPVVLHPSTACKKSFSGLYNSFDFLPTLLTMPNWSSFSTLFQSWLPLLSLLTSPFWLS